MLAQSERTHDGMMGDHATEFVTGSARCESCGAKAVATFDGETLSVVCDECGFERWGRAREAPDGCVGGGKQVRFV